ncbi:NlpC/P60 family protein [Aquamicrobium sp. LC103]|uniref:NlpC/P60 family protein n=1 Tax=Aquamicrobium sp. LC103 TaxID=1120658 RepID=UPI00063EB196|nr:NlpC/P60 family protein [Aquamicrobium sp. LC103]TKT81236.1 peptidase P60 [Aquamicrobium sp. LC103]
MSPPTDISEEVVAEAMRWLGTPYRHQGAMRGVGCDCLGLVRGVWREIYGREPETSGSYAPDWAEAGTGEPLLEAARRHCIEKPIGEMEPGDLILFRWKPPHAAKHLGILFTSDSFIHAYQGHSVLISPLVPQWRRKIAGAFAFPDRRLAEIS